jgi:hypothetical protein
VSFSLRTIDPKSNYWGSVSPKLFVKEKGKDQFVTYKKFKTYEQAGRRYFYLTNKPNEQLYYALDTVSNYSIGESSQSSSEVVVDIEYDKVITGITPKIKVTNHLGFNMANITISAPESLDELTALEGGISYLRGTLVLMSEKAQVAIDSEGNRLFIPGNGKIDTLKVL